MSVFQQNRYLGTPAVSKRHITTISWMRIAIGGFAMFMLASTGCASDSSPAGDSSFQISDVEPSEICPNGGVVLQFGVDSNNSGALEGDEIQESQIICNGTDGASGASLLWLGELPAHPSDPELNWAYQNTTDGIAYIWDGDSWEVLTVGGQDGSSINWLGEFADAPADPGLNDAYYNTTDGNACIWDGDSWQLLAAAGMDGSSINWLGELVDAPAVPNLNDGYYNSTDGNAYIWDGDSWEVLIMASLDGISINWLGELTAPPASPNLNDGYFNSTDGISYIWDGDSWEVLVEGLEVIPPVITNLNVVAAFGEARITWETDEPATSQVDYGLDTSYGDTTTLDDQLTTSHSVLLTGIAANTFYFQVRSSDNFGNEAADTGSFNLYRSLTFGGTAAELARAVGTTSDGDIVVAGYTTSGNGDTVGSGLTDKGLNDIFVIKITPLGEIIWKKRFGGNSNDEVFDMHVGADDEITIAGRSNTVNNGDMRDYKGNYDGIVMHLSATGDLLWARNLGSTSGNDAFQRIYPSLEGGYMVTGYVKGDGDNYDEAWGSNAGSTDAWLAFLNGDGSTPTLPFGHAHNLATPQGAVSDENTPFTLSIGTNLSDLATMDGKPGIIAGAVKPDGGFAMFGSSEMGSPLNIDGSVGDYDMFLSTWDRDVIINNMSGMGSPKSVNYGGAGHDVAVDALWIPHDVKFFLLGCVGAMGRDVDVAPNTAGIWISMASPNGWNQDHWGAGFNLSLGRTIAGEGTDYPYRAIVLSDEHVLIVGTTTSSTGDFATLEDWGSVDAFAMKINTDTGATMWKKKFGGTATDKFYDAVEASDGSIYYVGETNSGPTPHGGTESYCPPQTGKGQADFWILKTDANGNPL